jgi:hypothetical protein
MRLFDSMGIPLADWGEGSGYEGKEERKTL